MPSPVGHALAGLAIGWLARSASGPSLAEPGLPGARRVARALTGAPALAVALALLPDLDIVVGSHRTFSHSLGGTVLVGAAAWAVALARHRPPAVLALMSAAAFGSHAALDWLGRDMTAPFGLMALWPFSHQFYVSGLDVFAEVSRRYWDPAEFLIGNLGSVVREVLILGPVAATAFYWRQRSRPKPGQRGEGLGTTTSGPRPLVPDP